MQVKGNKQSVATVLFLLKMWLSSVGYAGVFCFRYKSLCPDTWPNWNGRLVDGVSTLVKHLGYKPEEYKLGRLVSQIQCSKVPY